MSTRSDRRETTRDAIKFKLFFGVENVSALLAISAAKFPPYAPRKFTSLKRHTHILNLRSFNGVRRCVRQRYRFKIGRIHPGFPRCPACLAGLLADHGITTGVSARSSKFSRHPSLATSSISHQRTVGGTFAVRVDGATEKRVLAIAVLCVFQQLGPLSAWRSVCRAPTHRQ